MRKNLFETPYAHTLLAFRGQVDAPGEAIGMAMYFYNYSTWTGKPGIYVCSPLKRPWILAHDYEHKLEDLFVKPETRGMGVGKAFFAELAKIAEAKVRAGSRHLNLYILMRRRTVAAWIGPY